MRFKKIEIKSFGKFKDFVLDFQGSGVQIIYGPNEYGKSTLMEFIKLMLYGRRGKDIAIKEDKILRAKYTPWNGTQDMEGAIEFFHKGCEYRIQKKLNSASPSKDIVQLYNMSLGEVVPLGKKEEVGEYLFKMDLKTFEKSCYIGDIGKAEFEKSKENEDNLSEKILNFSLTGDMNISVNKTILRINKAINDLKSLRGTKGKIPILESEISNLHESIHNLKNFEKEQLNILEKIAKIKKLTEEKTYLKNTLQSIETQKKINLVNNLIVLLKNKANYINKIESIGIPYCNLNDILENLTLIKKEIDLYSYKISEIKKIVLLKDQDLVCISDKEIGELNFQLTLKENLENKIRKIMNFKPDSINISYSENDLNSYFRHYAAEEIYRTLEEYSKYKNDLDEIKKIKDKKEKSEPVSKIQLKKEVAENSLKDKKVYYIKNKLLYASFVIVSIFSAFFIGYFISSNNFYLLMLAILFCVLSALEILNFKNLKNTIFSLKQEIEKLTLMIKTSEEFEFKILKTSENTESLKRKILNLIAEENNYLNSQIEKVKKFINKLLLLKKVPTIHDY